MTGGAYGYHAWEVTIGDLTKPVLMVSIAPQVDEHVRQELTTTTAFSDCTTCRAYVDLGD
jgi:hypothetical protein